MSTQGTLTAGRTGHIPAWPFVIAVLGVAVGVIGLTVALTVPRDRTPELIGSVATTQVLADSSAAVREAGVYATTRPGTVFPGALETAGVAIAQPGTVFPGALETAGVAIPRLDPAGFASEQAAKVRARYAAMAPVVRSGVAEPIVINGQVCHQCR